MLHDQKITENMAVVFPFVKMWKAYNNHNALSCTRPVKAPAGGWHFAGSGGVWFWLVYENGGLVIKALILQQNNTVNTFRIHLQYSNRIFITFNLFIIADFREPPFSLHPTAHEGHKCMSKSTFLVTYNAQWDLVSAFNPSPRSSGQPQHSAQGPYTNSEPGPQSRVLPGDRPIYILMETGARRGNPHEHRKHANSQRGPAPDTNQTKDLIAMR